MEPDQPQTVPDLIAAVDQWAAAVKDFVRVLRSHYEAALAQGFTTEQAFALTLGYQAASVGIMGAQGR